MTRHALITGISRGIGRAVGVVFAKQGWHVHGVSRRDPEIDGITHLAVDLMAHDALNIVNDHMQSVIKHDDIVCVVHCAGMIVEDSIAHIDADLFIQTMHLNVTLPALLTQKLLPWMGKGSSIIYMGSTLSEQGIANRLSYITSKHAVVGLMRATQQDLHGKEIHTVCVCPGFTQTDMLAPAMVSHPEFKQFIEDKVSFGRLIEPHEMAEIILFAAEHPLLNGSVLHANLGQRAT